jgi:hypothetical protein
MTALPNPDTYLNHIPPAQAAEFEAARNLSLAVLGVCTGVHFSCLPLTLEHIRQ